MSKEKIDFVVLWVDNNDIVWQKEKEKYDSIKKSDVNSIIRYRDWKTLKYWFRGVEKFAPWVNKIYFVTCGQRPEWLNIHHKKIVLVDHKDFIPAEILPTFNSNSIEMYINRIKGLSEHFVLFNDDMFIVNHLKEEDFFQNHLPVDALIFNAISIKKENNTIEHIILNNLEIMSKYYKKDIIMKQQRKKIFSLKYGKQCIRNFCLIPWKYFTGIYNPHMPIPYLKSTFDKIWKNNEELFQNATKSKFRSKNDYSHWVFRYDQLLSGNFIPKKLNQEKFYDLEEENGHFFHDLKSGKYKMVCINDSNESLNYETVQQDLIECFEDFLGEKSDFEL